ncbi:MAG: hypothetical protein KGL56_01025 [Alphaproteobacteria bacterium]|nr:hypothetical protein [Alphaproteobacteria bacterium]MDE2498745.1 hypothetical protein [Alphaproteobacteria bacterium]
MQILRSSFLSAGLLLGLSSVASADSDWKNVSLDNDPDFTIDVPSVVGDDYKPGQTADKNDVMFFAITSDNEDVTCLVTKFPYEKDTTQQKFAAVLATSSRDAMCQFDGKQGLDIGESKSLTSNGLQAGECAAAYTDPKEKRPGWVSSVTMIAAPNNVYQLSCDINADDQAEATASWVATWSDFVGHIRDSLHLPAAER